MGRKPQSAVDKIKGTQVQMKTGFIFIIGEPCKPTWDELRYTMTQVWAYDYGKDCLAHTNVPPETLMGGNQKQLEYMVPLVLQGLNRMFDKGTIDAVTAPQAVGMAYVLAWYWYHYLGGPMPIYEVKRYRTKKLMWHIEFECPACHKKYDPPTRFVKAEARCKAWLRWLPRHFREYHKWEVK